MTLSTASLMTATTAITMFTSSNSVPISVTHCQGGDNDDNSESILSKVKNMASGDFDWNGEVDLLGKEIGAKVSATPGW